MYTKKKCVIPHRGVGPFWGRKSPVGENIKSASAMPTYGILPSLRRYTILIPLGDNFHTNNNYCNAPLANFVNRALQIPLWWRWWDAEASCEWTTCPGLHSAAVRPGFDWRPTDRNRSTLSTRPPSHIIVCMADPKRISPSTRLPYRVG